MLYQIFFVGYDKSRTSKVSGGLVKTFEFTSPAG